MERLDPHGIGKRFAEGHVGKQMFALIRELFPLCRSITGDGVRQTLRILERFIPLNVHEVPTGTQVFDWSVPREWNIRDAYVKNSRGDRIIDFRRTNLHVVGYSTPIHRQMSLAELRPHLYSSAEHPDWVPYRTSFYQDNWGFCITHNQFLSLKDDVYEVCIDSSLEPGFLTYGEYFLPGELTEEVLISTHVCHPSLCNDNLSGVAVSVFLASQLCRWQHRRFSYRFLFIPSTIGSITWLARNEDLVPRIRHGLVLACLGDAGCLTYKKSRRGSAPIDRAAVFVLQRSGAPHEVRDFSPLGYDERQFCSPGFDLPVGCLMRTPNGRYPEYHTSADNLDFLRPEALLDSLEKALSILALLEDNDVCVNLNPLGEPQLGRRGLYQGTRGQSSPSEYEAALLWVLNGSTGSESLLDIAERSRLDFHLIRRAADALQSHGLLRGRTNSRGNR